MANYSFTFKDDSLEHHGIDGQKWGVRNGPPYPLAAGDHSAAEKRAMRKENKKNYKEMRSNYSGSIAVAYKPRINEKLEELRANNSEINKAAKIMAIIITIIFLLLLDSFFFLILQFNEKVLSVLS